MAQVKFSTGLPQLDTYLGGIQKGDSILWLTDRPREVNPLEKWLVHHCQQADIPILSLFASPSSYFHLLQFHSKRVYTLTDHRLKRDSILASIKRFLSFYAKGSCIVVEDLSFWKEALGSEKLVVQLFQMLARFASSSDSLLVTSAKRSEFQQKTIIDLKDAATIALDLFEREAELYCVPLSTMNRYVPFRFFPLNLNLDRQNKISFRYAPRYSPKKHTNAKTAKLFDAIRSDVFSSEERYRRLFENAGEPMMLFHRSREYREVNKKMAEMLGYSIEELRTISLSSLVAPEKKFAVLRLIAELKNIRHRTIQLKLVRRGGTILSSEAHISSIGEGWFLCVLSDNSSRQREQELCKALEDSKRSEQNYKKVVDNSPAAIAIFITNKLSYANAAFVKIFQCASFDELTSRKIFEFFTSESFSRLRNLLQSSRKGDVEVKGDSRQTIELEAVRKDGAIFPCECHVVKTSFDNRESLQLLLTDVSSKNHIIEEMRKVADRYRTINEQSSEAISVIRNGNFVYANPAFLKMFGFHELQELMNKELSIIVEPPQNKDITAQINNLETEKIASATCEFTGLRKNGSTLNVAMIAHCAEFEGTLAVIATYHDVTTIKHKEGELQIQARENEIIDEITSGMFESRELPNILNKALHKIIHSLSFSAGGIYTADESGKELHLTHHVNFPEKFITSISVIPKNEGLAGLAVKTQEPYQFTISEYPSYLPYRSIFVEAQVQTISLVPLISREKVVGFLLLFSHNEVASTSGSQRLYRIIGKLLGATIEEADRYARVERSLNQYRKLIEGLSDVIYSRSPDGHFLFLSPKIEHLVGYKQKDFYRNRSLWLSIIHPDDKKEILRQLANLETLQDTFITEYRVLPKGKAEYRWIRDSTSLVRNEASSVIALNGVLSDITEHKLHLENLREQTFNKIDHL